MCVWQPRSLAVSDGGGAAAARRHGGAEENH